MKKFLTLALPWFSLLIFLTVVTAGAFTGGVWAVAGIGGAILLFFAVWILDAGMPKPAFDLTVLALVTLMVIAASNPFSSQPQMSWHETLRLATIFLPLLVFTSSAVQARALQPRLFAMLPFVTGASAMLLGIELGSGGAVLQAVKGHAISLTEYNRGLSYVVVLAFAILAGLRTGNREQRTEKKTCPLSSVLCRPDNLSSLLFILAILYPTGLTESRASKLALIVGLAVTVIAHVAPKLTRRTLAVLPVLFIGWPFAAQWFFLNHAEMLKHFPDSWHHRIEIWDYMSYRIAERPWLGWGLGSSHSLDFQNPHGAQYVFATAAAAHPHNAFTQLWVELGLPGVALGVAFALLMLRRAVSLDARLSPYALGAWAAAFCLSMVAYGLWTDSLFAAFALTGFGFAMLRNKLSNTCGL